jgi:MoaA/NifB/PqqE/SkfB family radical SAM enzyme
MCNSRCRTCNIWKIYKDDPIKEGDELKTEEIISTINSIRNNLIWISFTGGEPTLRDDLESIVSSSYDLCKNLAVINLATNGLVPKREKEIFTKIINYCKDTNVYVTLSLDGLNKEHNRIRGVEGAYERVMKSFCLLKRLEKGNRNFHVSFQITLSKFNKNTILKTFDFVNKKADMNIIALVHENLFLKTESCDVDLRKEPSEFIRIIDKIQKKYPVRSSEHLLPKMYLKLAKLFLKTGKSPIPCAAGFSTVTIDPYGYVFPCENFQKSFGNLREFDYNLKRILNSKDAEKIKGEVKNCKKCWQNCEAIPSIIQNFPSACLKYLYRGL